MSSVSYVNREAPLQSDGVATLLQNEASGVAFDGFSRLVMVKDSGTPANDIYGVSTDLITTSRTTVAWDFDKNGVLVQYAANTPRYSYDPETFEPLGLSCEPLTANLALRNRDLTNAVWVKTDMTAAKDQVGMDAVASSASSITATSDGATALQTITSTSGNHNTYFYLKRLVGSGTVEITQDGGSTWQAVTLPATGWRQCIIPFATVGNPSFGIRLGTNGDSVAVDLVQCARLRYRTSPIITGASSVTRSAESHIITLSDTPFSPTGGTLYINSLTNAPAEETSTLFNISDGTANDVITGNLSTADSGALQIKDGGALVANLSATQSNNRGSDNLYAASWGANFAQVAVNGRISVADTSLTLPTVTQIQIGGSGTLGLTGHIREFVMVPRTADSTEINLLSSSGWPAVVPAVNVLPNDAAFSDTDYVGTMTATDAAVTVVRPITSTVGLENANPGWRRRFKTSAPYVDFHFGDSDAVTAEYKGRILISADDAIVGEAVMEQGAGGLVYRQAFPDTSERTIDVLAPYGAQMSHLGLTIPRGYTVSQPESLGARPIAAWVGGSRVNGYNATGPSKSIEPRFAWTRLLCDFNGWEEKNYGCAGRELVSSDGAVVGAIDPDIVVVQADTNDYFDQLPLVDYRANLNALIAGIRTDAPTVKIYVITSFYLDPSFNNLTIKIEDYRQAAADELTAIGDANNILVDGLPLVTPANMPDKLHPNEAGQAELLAALSGVLVV